MKKNSSHFANPSYQKVKLENRRILLKNLQELRQLNPRQFELYIKDLFLVSGYCRAVCTPTTNDEGRDIDVYNTKGDYIQVECKRYNSSKKVGRPDIQKFHSSLVDKNADKGMFITTSYFTKEAIAYANRHDIQLINAIQLVQWINEVNSPTLDSISTLNIKSFD